MNGALVSSDTDLTEEEIRILMGGGAPAPAADPAAPTAAPAAPTVIQVTSAPVGVPVADLEACRNFAAQRQPAPAPQPESLWGWLWLPATIAAFIVGWALHAQSDADAAAKRQEALERSMRLPPPPIR